jgi:DNA-binding PadR family transcriptional regulator
MTDVRRGHLKFYVLRLLSESRRTGYGLMKAIKEETGFWKPSAGSLYPLLAAMREQGLIAEVEEPDGATRWGITDEGRAVYAQASESRRELFDGMRQSLVVFSKVFDVDLLERMAERLGRWHEGREDFRTLGPLFMDLHDTLWALPPLSPEREAQAARILKDATAALERLREVGDTSSETGGNSEAEPRSRDR